MPELHRSNPPRQGLQKVHLEKVHLEEVQETLLMPLWARAVQSRKRFGLLKDPKAVEICDAIDYDFRKFNGSLQTQIGCVLRSMQLDAWVNDFLARNPKGTVIEMGAGLNSRYERTDNGQARYFEIDLPEALALRRIFYQETDRRRQIAASILDDSWIPAVQATGGPFHFVIEGVLMYFQESQVQKLFSRIARHFPGAYVAFDSLTTNGVAHQDRISAMSHFNASFDWGIDVPRDIEGWQDGYVCLDSVNLRHVAVRNRHLISWITQFAAILLASRRRAAVRDFWITLFRLG